MILDKATVAAENRAFTGAPQPLKQAAGELQIGCRLVGVEVGRAAFRAVRPGNIIVAIHVVRPSLRGDGIAPSLSPRLPDATPAGECRKRRARFRHPPRSEEHTSELQSLMRISYAVFCLKKKKMNKGIRI